MASTAYYATGLSPRRALSTRNTIACPHAQRWAVYGHRGRGHGAASLLGSGAPQDCLILPASRNGLVFAWIAKGAATYTGTWHLWLMPGAHPRDDAYAPRASP
jgi:hypothetical protein